ncbi:Ankyrin repeat-containing domain protein [Kalmanozyma brasiliensis GHG001]|uniref:Ankyrin repeat-containing domain protein n=1 Tax=Kalmanozyma brasiliensis (strain GHG001) TaxID=1365824 RepID=UPI002867F7EC|nr:Ankyrin repeat-containing domain protein [Kalmanozyma brasiliensis GHG001]KAF6767092.1 Ankyrin repeat-containing domain protein [Kalmanozyma brasiliensis GHG001]
MSAGRGGAQPLLISSEERRPVGIKNLPIEIIHRILVYSRSSAFPVTSRFFRQVCSSAATIDKADYILGRWIDHFIAVAASEPCRQRKHRDCASLASRLATFDRDGTPFKPTDCNLSLISTHHLDVLTFAAEFGIATVPMLEQVVDRAEGWLTQITDLDLALPSRDNLPRFPPLNRSETDDPIRAGFDYKHAVAEVLAIRPQLPKRIFRHIDHFGYKDDFMDVANDTAESASGSRPSKKRKRCDQSSSIARDQAEEDARFPIWMSKLIRMLANAYWRLDTEPQGEHLKAKVGPVPSAEDLHTLLFLLHVHGADASSHDGFGMAMAAQRRAFALASLLLVFKADVNRKDGFAARIAIRNGSRDFLDLLVSGARPDDELRRALAVTEIPLPGYWISDPELLKLDQSWLELAIRHQQWDVVNYIWYEQGVAPNGKCLRLIERFQSS